MIKEIDVKNKKVFVRVDFNIDLDKDGRILSDFRIKATIPTIQFLLKAGANKIILASHLGKPKAKEEEFSLKPIAEYLGILLGRKIIFLNDCIGDGVKKEIDNAAAGEIFLLENLRFHEEEEKNDDQFAKQLTNLADVYVNDAFGVCHRANASVVAITKFLPSCAGLLLEKEIENLDKVKNNFTQSLILILGGAKISTKLPLIKKFSKRSEKILLGGGLANTVLKARGLNVGKSLFEPELLAEVEKLDDNVITPVDCLVGSSVDDKQARIVGIEGVNDNEMILDIGPSSLDCFIDIIKRAETIIWNGPLGYFENDIFAKSTESIIKVISESHAFSVVGGGETLLALEKAKAFDKMSFVSTGGGAMLSYLSGEEMPGLRVLNQ